MYNRYIRNDNGSYTRIPEEGPPPGGASAETSPPSGAQAGGPTPGAPPPGGQQPGGPPPDGPGPGRPPQGSSPEGSHPGGPPPGGPPPNGPGGRPPHTPPHGGRPTDALTGFLQRLLDQFHLDHVDTGDLLLLALLFFLFREDADEELLVALGLLLIL
ncbi:MAG: hypothetical protein K2L38_08825 [Dysosmobacter sp.]|nr:hypothetical protein [Dysosmobacter sp.]